MCARKKKKKIGDLYDSLTCPWNDPINSNLNSLPFNLPYLEDMRHAGIPVYQPSSLLPASCYNSDTSNVHITLDQISFQFGASGNLTRTVNYPTFPGQTPGQGATINTGYFNILMPNPINNETRLFYVNFGDVVSITSSGVDYQSVIASSNNPIRYATNSTILPFEYGTILPTLTSDLKDSPGFPFQTVGFNFDAWNSNLNTVGNNTLTNTEIFQPQYYTQYQTVVDSPMATLCPSASLSALVPGCNLPGGCLFAASITQCYENSNTSFTRINNSANIFTTNGFSTGCGVFRTDCYRVTANPYFKPFCCRNSFTSDMLELTSLTVNDSLVKNNVGFAGTHEIHSYSAQVMYCDPSWTIGAQCDSVLQDFCATQTSTRDFGDGKGVQTIHAVLDGSTACGQWYAGLMYEYATYLFTQRNTDILGNMFVLYCGDGPGITAKNIGDSQTCLCINSFNANGLYYTPDTHPGSESKAFPVVGSSSQTDRNILFSDPVCGSVMCPTDPNFFTFPTSLSTLSTVVLPEIILQKRHCPKDICASVLGDVSIAITNFQGGTELNIGNFTNTCYISDGSGGSITRTITTQYNFSVQALDELVPLCGRWQYDITNGNEILALNGAAGFNLTFQVIATDPTQEVINLDYTLTGYSSQYFEFLETSGTFSNIQDGSTREINLQVHPYPVPPLDYAGDNLVIDRGVVTLTSNITGNANKNEKIFPVQILLYPNGALPVNPSSIIPSQPLPQKTTQSLSSSSKAILVLSLILILYSFGFFLEMINIRNLITSVQDFLPSSNQ